MKADMTVPCGEGILNLRVGAIILQDDRYLMVGNEGMDYLYSVGGRIQFGETAEEAVVREVFEETGVRMQIDRLGFIHEEYYYGDVPPTAGKLIYEIGFFFYMKVPADFEPVCTSSTQDGHREHLRWVSLKEKVKAYPAFFQTELLHPSQTVKHFVTDERKRRIDET